MKLLSRSARSGGQLVHLAVSCILLVAVAYLMGHFVLTRGSIGNDGHLHIAYGVWLDRYFPSVPNWYPIQGGGESLLRGYPILPHLLLVVVHRMSGLSIAAAFAVVGFATFPLTAITVYILVWSLFKSQNMGLIAGVLFLLCPVTWVWFLDWGFYPQAVATVSLPLVLAAFDRYLACLQDQRMRGLRRRWLAVLVLLMVWTMLAHPMVLGSAVAGMALWALLTGLTAPRGARLRITRDSLLGLVVSAALTGLVLASFLVPFYQYGLVAGREGLNDPAPHQLHRLPLPQFFEVAAIDPTQLWHRARFPLVVTVFFVVGALLGARKSRKLLMLALTSLVAIVYTLTPELVAVVLRVWATLYGFFNFRSLLILANILVPGVAAYGIWAVGEAMTDPVGFFRKPKESQPASPLRRALSGLRRIVAWGVSLAVAGVGIYYLGQVFALSPNSVLYGSTWHGIALENIWSREGAQPSSLIEQLDPRNWPRPQLTVTIPGWDSYQELLQSLPPERPLRIDISPYLGRYAMDFSTFADASQINSYTFQLSLFHAMWGYQQNVFFSREAGVAESGDPLTLNEVSQWFGTQYVFVHRDLDPVEMYEAAGWERILSDGALQLWHDPAAPPMATATSRPAVLVIGTLRSDAYMTIFRLANDGMLPYQEALLVEGRPRADSYSLEELQRFDAVILYGYDYKSSRRAWNTLAAYVEQGGSLFVDTGWEFWIPEWEFDTAPDVLPLERIQWTDYGLTSDYHIDSPDIAGDVDLTLFKPLEWEGQAWTVSGAQPEDVRPWARTVLSASGRPLIVAGQYGQGRVVWSGFNLIGHARYLGKNEEEVRLMHNLLAWLTQGHEGQELDRPMVIRDYPDEVRFSMSTVPGDVTWLYWREAYYPDWHAYVAGTSGTREIPIYRGGPGLMLMPVDASSETAVVQLVWRPSFLEATSVWVSGLGVGIVLALLLDGLLLGGNGFTWLRIAIEMKTPRPLLREGSNVEWAEKKKAEIAARRAGSAPSRPEGRTGLAGPVADRQEGGSLTQGPVASSPVFFEESGAVSTAEQEALLRSWLEAKGQMDDEWAGKILTRRESGRRARTGGPAPGEPTGGREGSL